ncbi:hypothetical protein CC78DRAFT_200820 [Lojkania enalia]|uniref:Uncharacterized protein n=1 Tax=Lojkania enalia TaxID=147567 RepID=A0A9P4KBC9_9PLEO|nr:hypothetical protein CC78DRAFT_200820 [Didymosphaeria enalia]
MPDRRICPFCFVHWAVPSSDPASLIPLCRPKCTQVSTRHGLRCIALRPFGHPRQTFSLRSRLAVAPPPLHPLHDKLLLLHVARNQPPNGQGMGAWQPSNPFALGQTATPRESSTLNCTSLHSCCTPPPVSYHIAAGPSQSAAAVIRTFNLYFLPAAPPYSSAADSFLLPRVHAALVLNLTCIHPPPLPFSFSSKLQNVLVRHLGAL